MSDTLHIDSNNVLPKSEDYDFLRKEGISFIQNFSGKTWTDYNRHDPGITLLEAFCYALTDLGYRASFDIQDIIAKQDTSSISYKNEFFTAREILPCNPVTLIDYRKLIIDIQGISNAWIEVCEDAEIAIFMAKNGTQFQLSYEPNADEDLLQLNGLYKVFVEYEDDIVQEKKEDEVIKRISDKLHAHRNLCEDFVSIAPVQYELFAIEAEIKAREDSDIEKINATIYSVIHDYFSPPVRFYSLDQMQQKGYSAEDIFDGPLLKHGFLITEELEKSERFKEVHLSDIVNLILSIDGVMAINKLTIPKEELITNRRFSEWVSNEKEQNGTTKTHRQKAPKLDIKNSIVTFVKTGDSHRSETEKQPNKLRVNAIFSFLQAANKRSKLKGNEKDFEIPAGEYMDITEYFPFQKSLPACYYMDETFMHQNEKLVNDAMHPDEYYESKRELNQELKDDLQTQLSSLDKYKKQTLQLRGFLLIFEQILANYMSQLAHVRQLFSYDTNVQNTYFPQIPIEINDLEALFIDYDKYVSSLSEMIESESTFIARRHIFLDHLMARFGEIMPNYGSTIHENHTKDKRHIRLINDKIHFLQDYIQLSNYRGKGFDYTDPNATWNTHNVEGFKKRVCKLLGFKDYARRQIASHAIHIKEIKHENNICRYEVILSKPDDRDDILLKSDEYEFRHEAQEILNYILKYGSDEHLYDIGVHKGRYCYQLKMPTPDGNIEFIAKKHFPHNEDGKCKMEDDFKETIELLSDFAKDENFHVMEHILLRPKIDHRDKTPKRNPIIDADVVSLLPILEEVLPNLKQIPDVDTDEYKFVITNNKAKSTWKLALITKQDKNEVLSINEEFVIYKDLTKRIEHLNVVAADSTNYLLKPVADGRVILQILHQNIVLAESRNKTMAESAAQNLMDSLLEFFSNEKRTTENQANEDELEVSAYLDPYSFNVSIIIPDWPARFRDATFKHLLEKAIYLETPAHVVPNVIWIDHEQMRSFEAAYKRWLEDQASTDISNTEYLNNLIFELSKAQKNGKSHH
jgi:hypothetical protein